MILLLGVLVAVALVAGVLWLQFTIAVAALFVLLVLLVLIPASIWVRRGGRRTAPKQEAARMFTARRV